MINDILTFFQVLKYPKRKRLKKSATKNILIAFKEQIKITDIKETKNIIIENKEKHSISNKTLLVLKIKNSNSFDRIGIIFEEYNNNVYLTITPYFIVNFLKIGLKYKEEKVSLKTYSSIDSIELKTKITDKEFSIEVENKYIKDELEFQIIEF